MKNKKEHGYILRYYLPVKPHFDEGYTKKRFDDLLDYCKKTKIGAVMFLQRTIYQGHTVLHFLKSGR